LIPGNIKQSYKPNSVPISYDWSEYMKSRTQP